MSKILSSNTKAFFGGGGSSGNATSSNMGVRMQEEAWIFTNFAKSAAAMQALKMFTGGQGAQQASTGPGGAQNAFVGMAMGEAIFNIP